MANIITRAGKGAPLSWNEADANFINLNTELSVHIDDAIDAHASSAIGYIPAGTGAVVTDVQTKLHEFVSIKDFGAVGDGITDDTKGIQSAFTAAAGKTLLVPPGEYVISTINIEHDIVVFCQLGAIFKRKEGLDVRVSDWTAGTAMFEIRADGKTVHFVGHPTFDGNKQNQPVTTINPGMAGATTEPNGRAIQYKPVNPATATDCRILVENGVFRNGTAGYIMVAGDDVNRRFKTIVTLINTVMTDTVRGYGLGDPATPTALGWNSDYIRILDYVELNSHDIDLSWSQYPTPTGAYAPVGIRATFYGVSYLTSGNAKVNLYGTTKLKGLGRKAETYDGGALTGNNGIGAVDCYGNTESLFAENVHAVDCELIPLRAKGSIERFIVLNAYLKNCKQGIEVGPSSTGPCQADVFIGTLKAEGGYEPQLTLSGTSSVDMLRSVFIQNALVSGTTNGFSLADTAAGAIRIRYVDQVICDSLSVSNSATTSINSVDNKYVSVKYFHSLNSGGNGFAILSSTKKIHIESGRVVNAAQNGVYFTGSPEKINATAVHVDGAVNYSIFANLSAASDVSITGCYAANISGASRGFYISHSGVINNCYVGAGVTTPLVTGSANLVTEYCNSWNKKHKQGSAAPTTGTWAQGDVVFNTAPAAAGTIGWVCTTAGTPGTWKTFGSIAA